MRQFVLQPRWIPWHLLCVAVTVLFIRLSIWQWDVAHMQAQLDWQSFGYAVQWIFFIGFVWWFWWKVMKDQQTIELQRQAKEREMVD
ncbi:MAG: hypothetical protein V9E82_13900 [Candidatus Nanopelagicales bacterium]